jgi:hypothetical protein
MKIAESSTFSSPISADGTDTGTIVGNMSAVISTTNQSINFNAVISQGVTVDAAIVQTQFTSFISDIRAKASSAGLVVFAEGSVQ